MGKRFLQSLLALALCDAALQTSVLASPLSIRASTGDSSEDLTKYVDLLIGTQGAIANSSMASGNVFPGAAVPFGVVKMGIDTQAVWLDPPAAGNNGGYTPLGNLTGISMMHESGTGGEPKYGVVSQMPLTGDLEAQGINVANNFTYQQPRASDKASVGHWQTNLTNGVSLDLTAARHSGIANYRYPGGDKHILVDLSHVLPDFSSNYSQHFRGGSVHIAEDNSSYYGSAQYDGGWNREGKWGIHFCANFSNPFSKGGVFSYPYNTNQAVPVPPTKVQYGNMSASTVVNGNGTGIGALFTWSGNQSSSMIESRIGISFISEQKACQFIHDEVPKNLTFDDVVAAARKEWNDDVLSSIIIPSTGGERNQTLLRMLYTGLYYTSLLPSDRTGENPKWQTNEPSYDDFYTMWDIFRCLTPMYGLLQTPRYVDMVRSLIDIWRHDGYLPDGRSGNANGMTQGGSNADNTLADAYVKGFDKVKNINWDDGWKALVKDAEVQPHPTPDYLSWDGGDFEGRVALDDWINVGWITRNHSRSVSRVVEYAQNDFGLYQVAKRTGKPADAQKYLKRSGQWENMWNGNLSTTLPGLGSFNGFLCPRDADGKWNFTSPDGVSPPVNVTNCGLCEWTSDTYEALIWEYSFNVPHDTASLIKKMGGPEEFVRRLDASFVQGYSSGGGAGNTAGSALMNPGNEPSFLTPFLYNHAPGYQWHSVNQTRGIINMFYNDKANGIPGNSDAGAMQSWMLWNFMGLYPVTEQPIYLLTSPFFKSMDVRLLTAQMENTNASPVYLHIRAPNLTPTSFYVRSVKLNGKNLNRTFVYHDEIASGATLEFDVGPEPVQWDKGFQPPPSVSLGTL